jgi:Bacterial Ig-like domain (group 3)/FG-GAP-like repeat
MKAQVIRIAFAGMLLCSLSSAAQVSFAPGIVYYIGNGVISARPLAVAVGDLNHDGIPDLVISECGVPAVYLGNGDGTFQKGPSYYGPCDYPGFQLLNNLALVDVNGDGNLDAVFNSSGTALNLYGSPHVYLGNGDGTFQSTPIVSPSPACPSGPFSCGYEYMNFGDFNGDGKVDIIFSSSSNSQFLGTGSMIISWGNGDGTFSPANNLVSEYASNTTVVSDLRGDGIDDLIVDTCNSDFSLCGVGVYVGNGDGTFQVPVIYGGGTLSTAAELISGGHFIEAKPFQFVTSNGSQTFVYPGKGDGTFESPIVSNTSISPCQYSLYSPATFRTRSSHVTSLAGVGYNFEEFPHDDVACFIQGNGHGTFQSLQLFPTGIEGNLVGTVGFTVADLNGDGKPDVVIFDRYYSRVSVLLNSTNRQTPTVTLASSSNPSIGDQKITFTASVTPKPLNWPEETVTFLVNGKPYYGGKVRLVDGQASFSTIHLPYGSSTITADYSGDCCDYLPASASLSQVVNK